MAEAFFPERQTSCDLIRLFQRYNLQYFGGVLRPSAGFQLRFTHAYKTAGCFIYCRSTHEDWAIRIARHLQNHPRALRGTLVHEMIHMLAHQNFRNTGDSYYLDREPQPGQPFVNKGHGAFFLAELKRLNTLHPELGLSIFSTTADPLYDSDKIPPARLLVVHIDNLDRGMIYRLHPQAELAWQTLRETAETLHGSTDITLLEVNGAAGEGFPLLRRDNRPRRNMKLRYLRHFSRVSNELFAHAGSVCLREISLSSTQQSKQPAQALSVAA